MGTQVTRTDRRFTSEEAAFPHHFKISALRSLDERFAQGALSTFLRTTSRRNGKLGWASIFGVFSGLLIKKTGIQSPIPGRTRFKEDENVVSRDSRLLFLARFPHGGVKQRNFIP
jgi:hypothetical protein